MWVLLFWPAIVAAQVASIEPAATSIPYVAISGAPLQTAEVLQLSDAVISRIASDEATKDYARHFVFENSTIENVAQSLVSCKTFPGDLNWPTKLVWDIFDAFLGGALIPTVPIASSCYETKWGKKDSTECASVVSNFTNPLFHESDPTSIMWPIFQGRTCMPANNTGAKQCDKGAYPEFAVKVRNVAQIQLAVNFARIANMRLVIKNTGHCYLGKSSGAGALSLWMHNMKDIDFLPAYQGPGYSGPALKLAAGVTVREVYEAADKNDVTVTGAVSWVSDPFSLFKGCVNEVL
jgi:hypothetical protein